MISKFFHQLYNKIFIVWPASFSNDPQLKLLMKKLYYNRFDFKEFQRSIYYRPKKWKFFLQALIHRSYLQLLKEKWESNERLEFLGDAVLNFIVAKFLYDNYPNMDVGELSKLRSRLVNRKILAQRAKELKISDFLLMSESAAQSLDCGSESIISDAFESIVGAIYLDGGCKAAKKFIYKVLLENEEVISYTMMDDNFKSALLEYAQANSLEIPKYYVIHEEGPEHNRRFTVEVLIDNKCLGVGYGRNKKEAEQSAAAEAMKNISQK